MLTGPEQIPVPQHGEAVVGVAADALGVLAGGAVGRLQRVVCVELHGDGVGVAVPPRDDADAALLAGVLGERIRYDLRKKMFNHLQDLSFSYYDRTPVGWIMSRVTSDSDRIAELVTWGLLDVTWGTVSIATAMYFMMIINWKLALIVALIGVAVVRVSQKRPSQTEMDPDSVLGDPGEATVGADGTPRIRSVVLPAANQPRIEELTDDALAKLEFHFVSDFREVVEHAFAPAARRVKQRRKRS